MRISNPLPDIRPRSVTAPTASPVQNFQTMLQQHLTEVNQLQNQADTAAEQLALGQIEFHDAVIAAEKAALAIQLTMAVRNKVMDAYQEIMRMQV